MSFDEYLLSSIVLLFLSLSFFFSLSLSLLDTSIYDNEEQYL